MDTNSSDLTKRLNLNKDELQLKAILKKLIIEKGLTIKSFSKGTLIPVQTLHGWLQGSEPKNLKQVKRAADYLGVDINGLCFGDRPKDVRISDYQDEINAGIFEVVLRKKR